MYISYEDCWAFLSVFCLWDGKNSLDMLCFVGQIYTKGSHLKTIYVKGSIL